MAGSFQRSLLMLPAEVPEAILLGGKRKPVFVGNRNRFLLVRKTGFCWQGNRAFVWRADFSPVAGPFPSLSGIRLRTDYTAQSSAMVVRIILGLAGVCRTQTRIPAVFLGRDSCFCCLPLTGSVGAGRVVVVESDFSVFRKGEENHRFQNLCVMSCISPPGRMR